MKKKILTTDSEILTITKWLIRDEIFYIAGSYSVYVPSLNTSWIDKSVVKDWPDLNGEVQKMTPGEAARTELNRWCADKLPKKGFTRKADMKYLDLSQPRYFKGKRVSGDLVYIDLRSAYWQIYQELTLDACWPRGVGAISLRPVAYSLTRWKAARNSVIGIVRSKEVTTVKGRVIKYQPYKNPFFNPQLWFTVQNILHEIAFEAYRAGAVYINTDGYIFRQWGGWKKFCALLDKYKFEYRCELGQGEVIGWNSYHILGVKTTEPYRLGLYSTTDHFYIEVAGRKTLDWFLSQKGRVTK